MNSLLLATDTAGYTMPQTWRVLTKAGYFIGLSGAIGTTVTYATTVRPSLKHAQEAGDPGDAVVLRSRSASYAAWAGVVLLLAGYFQLAGRVARAGKGMAFGDALAPGRMWDFLQAPAAKGAWIAQGTVYLVQNLVLLAAAAAMIALFLPAARRHLDRIVLAVLPAALAVTLIAAVPATAPADLDRWLDLFLNQTHIVSGTVWLGGLALLVALAGARAGLGEGAGVLWAEIWRRFSLVALVCVGAVVLSGLWLSWKHVGAVSQLWTTGYGIALLVKILLVLGLITAGAFNQFLAHAPHRPGPPRRRHRLAAPPHAASFPPGGLGRGRPRGRGLGGRPVHHGLRPFRGRQCEGRVLRQPLRCRSRHGPRPGRVPLRHGQGLRGAGPPLTGDPGNSLTGTATGSDTRDGLNG